MRIRLVYQRKTSVYETTATVVVIGRAKPGVLVDLDLSPDELVSRPHARILYEGHHWWIEDLGSRRGTKVDGREIKGGGKVILTRQTAVRLGATTLGIEDNSVETGDAKSFDNAGDAASFETPAGERSRELEGTDGTSPEYAVSRVASTGAPDDMTFSMVVPITEPVQQLEPSSSPNASNRERSVLYDLLLASEANDSFDKGLQQALDRLIAAIPAAERGALLVKQSGTGTLLLMAHLPPGKPAVSETLAKRAIDRREAFIWAREFNMSVSQVEYQIASGMYAPMIWKGEIFGIICLDNSDSPRQFTDEDLRLLVALSQHFALAISNQRLREELQLNVALTERLLTNFSPTIRTRLLAKARRGRLRLGGEKSEVTILSSDIRGFTRIAANMDVEDVVDMLNSYFSVLVEAIFRHDGTVDKFIGDAILAVFGSPEHDEDQHAKAVRAALAMQDSLEKVNAARRSRGQITCELGIGIHCGQVLHGFIGSEERMEFTVIGDAVNRTARYCDGAAAGQVLISPELHQRVWRLVRTESVTIPTKHEGELQAFRLLACKPAP